MLRENALPVWMTQSSVPTDSSRGTHTTTEGDAGEDGAPAKRIKVEHENGSKVKAEDDGDEDDMEFEDVM